MCNRTINGKTSEFGTTGYTHDDVFVLYDRNTGALWYPLEDEALDAVTGTQRGQLRLPILAEPHPMTLKKWRQQHPDTLVLMPPPEDIAAMNRGFLGVRFAPDSAVIDAVVRNTAAAVSGLLAGDRIVSIDNHRVATLREVRNALLSKQRGDRIEFIVERNGKELPVGVRLGARGRPRARF